MSYLCLRCGFQDVPDCPCKRYSAYEAKAEAIEAAVEAMKAERTGPTPMTFVPMPLTLEDAMSRAGQHVGPDMVNHPPHYASGAVECIDAIHAALGDDGLVAYCRGNAIKYLWRTGKKGDAVQDLEKAVWYIQKAVEVARGARP